MRPRAAAVRRLHLCAKALRDGKFHLAACRPPSARASSHTRCWRQFDRTEIEESAEGAAFLAGGGGRTDERPSSSYRRRLVAVHPSFRKATFLALD